LRKLLAHLAEHIGGSIPWASQDWANTKAAYRFFSNPRISEEEILGGHVQATRERIAACGAVILMLHDGPFMAGIRPGGHPAQVVYAQKQKGAPAALYRLRHSDALHPGSDDRRAALGLAAVKLWTRDEFKGCNALKKKLNPTRVPIERKESYRWLENVRQARALFEQPERCVHIGDRESDIYELFCTAQEADTHFLVRTCGGSPRRRCEPNDLPRGETCADTRSPPYRCPGQAGQGVGRGVRDSLSPAGCASADWQAEELLAVGIHRNLRPGAWPTQGREKIDWKLLTDLPVRSCLQAIEKLQWYAQRWKIETFHKILKSGCKAEEYRLRTAERLVNLVAILCILSWRIFWMTMANGESRKRFPKQHLQHFQHSNCTCSTRWSGIKLKRRRSSGQRPMPPRPSGVVNLPLGHAYALRPWLLEDEARQFGISKLAQQAHTSR
jgi:Transposase DNA-binding